MQKSIISSKKRDQRVGTSPLLYRRREEERRFVDREESSFEIRLEAAQHHSGLPASRPTNEENNHL
jgi:hypothetical protein